MSLIRTTLIKLGDLCDNNEVSWDDLMKIKVGKTVGIVQKAAWSSTLEPNAPEGTTDPLNTLATKLIRKFRDMAERNRPLWS